MEFTDVIEKRYSCKNYSARKVEDEKLAAILNAGPLANHWKKRSLTLIGLAAPTSTVVGIVLNVCFYLYLERKEKKAA